MKRLHFGQRPFQRRLSGILKRGLKLTEKLSGSDQYFVTKD